ncbi:DUF5682 family protein [Streptomyces sp. M10(2022)]
MDAWLTGVPAGMFTDVLPLLRRTSRLTNRAYGAPWASWCAAAGPGRPQPEGPEAGTPGFGAGIDADRADAVLPVLRLLLGHDTGPQLEAAV